MENVNYATQIMYTEANPWHKVLKKLIITSVVKKLFTFYGIGVSA
jgi:hypothetical protein